MDDFFEASRFEKSSNLSQVQNRFFTSSKDLNSILYGIQYNVINILLTFIFGTLIELIFPIYQPTKSNLNIVFEVIFQGVIISLIIHYIKKLGNKIPFFLGSDNDINKNVSLDIVITLVFVCTQVNFLKKIQHLSKKGVNWINSKLKPKPKINQDKKEQIKNIVKKILKKGEEKQKRQIMDQTIQSNKIKSVTNQINQLKQINQQNQMNQGNDLVPMPSEGKFSNLMGGDMNMNSNNFHDNFPTPMNSMDQNTNLNSKLNMEGFRSNMNRNDYQNILNSF